MKPDLIIRYPSDENGFSDLHADRVAYAVVYVRPETNGVLYERAILAGIARHGEPIYMANLNGALFLQDRILEEHYTSQFRFAADPLAELRKYPQIAARFEEHFRVPAHEIRLLGSFAAINELGIGEEELFETIVPTTDYLECWGQSFKRISGCFIVNPNLPAIVKRYTPSANVFVVAVRSRDASAGFFQELNHAIFLEIVSREETPVIDGEKLDSLFWSERIRRTYHISANHVMAMLDMSDLVYKNDRTRLDIAATPLGRRLVRSTSLGPRELRSMRSRRLLYLRREGRESLEFLPLCANGMPLTEIERLLGGS